LAFPNVHNSVAFTQAVIIAYHGGLMTAMVLVWILMGLLVGFSSSCLYKMFKGSEWKEITFQTAFLCREPLLLGSLQIWMK
jgi:hypothetical protein